jgi:hypothetical protein
MLLSALSTFAQPSNTGTLLPVTLSAPADVRGALASAVPVRIDSSARDVRAALDRLRAPVLLILVVSLTGAVAAYAGLRSLATTLPWVPALQPYAVLVDSTPIVVSILAGSERAL